jgi:hypothetical protein
LHCYAGFATNENQNRVSNINKPTESKLELYSKLKKQTVKIMFIISRLIISRDSIQAFFTRFASFA